MECKSLDSDCEYDYVIVGGGSAGSVLASRLSELPGAPRVCVLERGPPQPHSRWPVAMPAACILTRYHSAGAPIFVHNASEPEAGLDGRRIACPRGTTWGGCSTVNSLVFVRGHRSDFDRWATQLGCGARWNFDACLPFFKRLESYIDGLGAEDAVDRNAEEDYSKQVNHFRGRKGPIKVISSRVLNARYTHNPLHRAFIRAGIEAGHRYNPDFNGAEQEGVGWMDANVGDGERQSTAKCYLEPALERPNLEVRSEALVHRIRLEGKRVTEVIYEDSRGNRHVVRAVREVILCAGVYNTPQLLMLSGIGDPQQLQSVGIEPLHELPAVGLNLQDHLVLVLKWETKHPKWSLAVGDWTAPQFAPFVEKLRAEWEKDRCGWGASNHYESGLFFRTHSDLPLPNMEAFMSPALYTMRDGRLQLLPGITVFISNLRPKSVGRVGLSSRDAAAQPLIQNKYLSAPEDLRELVEAVRVVRCLMAQPALADWVGAELQPGPEALSDAELEHFVRANAISFYHPCGTCRMGDEAAASASVLDAELRVRGIRGLRIADASAMPCLTSGNILAPVLMLAERAAQFIAEEHRTQH